MQASLLISCTITTNVQTNQICLVLFQLIECYPTSVCKSQVVVNNVQTMAKPLLKQCDKTSKLTNSWLQKHQLNDTMHNKQDKYSFMLCWGDLLCIWLPHILNTHKRHNYKCVFRAGTTTYFDNKESSQHHIIH